VGLRNTLFGLVTGVLVAGCAAGTFGYKYYGLEADRYDGRLLGPSEAEDRPFADCTPTASNKGPCIVVLTPEFLRIKQEVLELRERLKSCEEGRTAEK
jgi:hypothetical protein